MLLVLALLALAALAGGMAAHPFRRQLGASGAGALVSHHCAGADGGDLPRRARGAGTRCAAAVPHPGATKTRRVHRRALELFRAAAEKRTRGSTGVLVYPEPCRASREIIADEAIHSKVTADVWGAAMAALVGGVKHDRPGEGMVEAVQQIGLVLAEHFRERGRCERTPRPSDRTMSDAPEEVAWPGQVDHGQAAGEVGICIARPRHPCRGDRGDRRGRPCAACRPVSRAARQALSRAAGRAGRRRGGAGRGFALRCGAPRTDRGDRL